MFLNLTFNLVNEIQHHNKQADISDVKIEEKAQTMPINFMIPEKYINYVLNIYAN